MRLVAAATGQAYVVHPTAKFQQQDKTQYGNDEHLNSNTPIQHSGKILDRTSG